MHFNCSATNSYDSGLALCEANLTVHHAPQKIGDSFVSYLIDAVYAIAHALDNIYRCSLTIHGASKRGKCPPVKPTIKGRDLEKYLRNISFDGLTGKVGFDEFGDPLTASYDIINYQLDSTTDATRKNILVGSWDKKKHAQTQSRFVQATMENSLYPVILLFIRMFTRYQKGENQAMLLGLY